MRRETLAGATALLALIPLLAGATARPAAKSPPSPNGAGSTSASVYAPSSAAPENADMSEVPQQVVWLRSGGVVRGFIVEFVPTVRVVLQLATGELRTIAWKDVERASWVKSARISSSAPPSSLSGTSSVPPSSLSGTSSVPPSSLSGTSSVPEAATSAPTEEEPPPQTSPGVVIHLLGDRPGLQLEARPRYGEGSWRPLCSAPCGGTMDVHRQSLRVTGPGTTPSNPFHVAGRVGEETIDVNAGSAAVHRWGERSLVAGIGLALVGGLAFGLGRVEDQDAAVIGGVIGLALGGAGILAAFPLLGTSGTTVRNGEGERVGTSDARWRERL